MPCKKKLIKVTLRGGGLGGKQSEEVFTPSKTCNSKKSVKKGFSNNYFHMRQTKTPIGFACVVLLSAYWSS